MKRLAILPLIITISCGMLSGDSVDVINKAKAKTDMQIESTYRQSPVNPVLDAIRYDFRELRRLIDSLNVETLLAISRADSASAQRDSAAMIVLSLVAENTKLKAENASYQEDFRVITWGPHMLVIFIIVFAASLVSHGAYEAYKQRRK